MNEPMIVELEWLDEPQEDVDKRTEAWHNGDVM